MPYTYEYPRANLTVDCVVFGLDEGDLKVLLIQRDLPPFQGYWALPGGFVHVDESLEAAARRELQEETGVEDVFLEQLYAFGAVDRDPRERVVSIAYYVLVNLNDYRIKATTDARDAAWFSVKQLPDLPFDHNQIFRMALEHLQNKVHHEPIGFELLPPKFTLTQLQKLYESILGYGLDKRNFRKKFLKMDLLIDLNEHQRDVPHRAARLYQFDEKKYINLKQKGFVFEI